MWLMQDYFVVGMQGFTGTMVFEVYIRKHSYRKKKIWSLRSTLTQDDMEYPRVQSVAIFPGSFWGSSWGVYGVGYSWGLGFQGSFPRGKGAAPDNENSATYSRFRRAQYVAMLSM